MRKLIIGFTVLLLILSIFAVDNYNSNAETVHLSGSNIYFTIPDLEDSVTDIHEYLKILGAPVKKIATTTEDLDQAAASYTLFTGTTADVILESISLRNANVDCSDDATFTGISIQTDDVTPCVFISQGNGLKANLTEEATIAWTGSEVIKTGTIITLTIYGAATDATCEPDIMVAYRSTGTGTGTLAP